MGFCGKDRWRTPLTGLELRACWEEGRRGAPIAVPTGPPVAGAHSEGEPAPPSGAATNGVPSRTWTAVRGDGGPLDRPDPMRLRGFVPLDQLAGPTDPPAPEPTKPAAREVRDAPDASRPAFRASDRASAVDDWEARVSLFGEAEL